jgi:DNA gyrase/topoisomerase IV subunit B
MAKQNYTSDDIKLLSDREHVRLRTAVYLGSTNPHTYRVPLFTDGKFSIEEMEFIPAVYKAVGEIIDNSIDEFENTKQKRATLTITADPSKGEYTIADNGRGIPIDMHESGAHTPQVVLGSLRSGRNFSDDKQAGVIGQNGVGSACTNYCSTELKVAITRDNKKYTQVFKNGAEDVCKPKITTNTTAKTGTAVSFKLDDTVFKKVALPTSLVENRAIEIAFNNPNITVDYNKQRYRYSKGLEDIVKHISSDYFKFSDGNMEFFVIFDVHEGIDEEMFTWVNSSLLFDGGLCNTQFLNAFYDRVIKQLASAAKRKKCAVNKNDIKQNLLILGSMKIADPEYDAQSKTRLTGPNLRTNMQALIEDGWKQFSRKQKAWMNDVVLERANKRHHKKADAEAAKQMEKNRKNKVEGLIDATGKNRFDCKLVITEGLSAASMITEVRDPKTIGSLPLSGKINNVYDNTPGQVIKMPKIVSLLHAIGLVPGKKAIRSALNYGQLIIATDADTDGGDIFTLLINLLYAFWPELFDASYEEPFVLRLNAPNVVASKGKNRIHFPTMDDFRKKESKYKSGWEIEYFKGLGSMTKEDWAMIMSNLDDHTYCIYDDGDMKETLKLLFGPDTDARKDWLTQ